MKKILEGDVTIADYELGDLLNEEAL